MTKPKPEPVWVNKAPMQCGDNCPYRHDPYGCNYTGHSDFDYLNNEVCIPAIRELVEAGRGNIQAIDDLDQLVVEAKSGEPCTKHKERWNDAVRRKKEFTQRLRDALPKKGEE